MNSSRFSFRYGQRESALMIEPERTAGPDSPAGKVSAVPPERSSFLTTATYLLVPAVFLAHVWRFNFLCDDAFISFRYARNLARGLGLCFNPGESPPVEGFSNFLWVMLMSAFERLELPPAAVSRLVSVLCGVLLVVLLLRHLGSSLGMPRGVVLLSGLFFALFPPVAVWTTGGLATVPFALLVFVSFVLLTDSPNKLRGFWAGLAGLGVVLLRTEGFAWALAVGAVSTVMLRLRSKEARSASIRTYVVMVTLGFAAYEVWRIWYFGDWVSNTARAKADLTAFTLLRGCNYAASFVLHNLSPGVILLASLSLVSRPRGGPALGSLLMLWATFAAAILEGGDFMPFERMFVVGTPFLTILLACALNRWWQAGRSHRAGACALAAACMALSLLPAFDVYLVPESVREAFRFRWAFFREEPRHVRLSELRAWRRSKTNCRNWARIGRALKLVSADGDSIVLGAIGAMGYYSDLQVYDLGGLVDREVARRPPLPGRHSAGHDKAVPIAYFENRNPTYVYAILQQRGADLEQQRAWAHALFLDRPGEGNTKDRYNPVVIPLPPEAGFDRSEVLIVGKRSVVPDTIAPEDGIAE
jgi:hypothetical protein